MFSSRQRKGPAGSPANRFLDLAPSHSQAQPRKTIASALGKNASSKASFTNATTPGSFDPRLPATLSTLMLFSRMKVLHSGALNSASFQCHRRRPLADQAP